MATKGITFAPRVDYRFGHSPLIGAIAFLDHEHDLDWKVEATGMIEEMYSVIDASLVEVRASREYFSACIKAHNPFEGVARALRLSRHDQIPITNAYCKMHELCFVEEVRAVLNAFGESGHPIRAMFLAEAPGLFPIAVGRYFAKYFQSFDGFRYHCTTLESGLHDQYGIIAANREKWTFMDHTSSIDTRKLIARFVEGEGEGAMDLVVGDIGKESDDGEVRERDMFREELGQMVSALALMKNGGTAILKMFSIVEYSTACMLRLAMGVCDHVRIVKPYTSRSHNTETYWILSGFKRPLFLPLLEPLLKLMDEANREKESVSLKGEKAIPFYRGFLHPDNFLPPMIRRLRLLFLDQHCRHMSAVGVGLNAFERIKEQIARTSSTRPNPFDIQVELMRGLSSLMKPYIQQWMTMFQISPISLTGPRTR